MLTLGSYFEVPGNTVLISQGSTTNDVFLLADARSSGPACAKVVQTQKQGYDLLLGLRGSGDVVGEMAGLDGSPRRASIITCTPVALRRFARPQFDDFLRQRPEIYPKLMAMIAARLDWANRQRGEVSTYPVEVRLARTVLEVLERYGYRTSAGHHVGVGLSQLEWGQLIGARVDAVNKATRQLRASNLLRTDRRKFVVTNMPVLRRMADLD